MHHDINIQQSVHRVLLFSMQMMLLDNSLQLPPPALVLYPPSDVLLEGIVLQSLPGVWVGAVIASFYI